ncbi:MAG: DedA family protein [Pseudomonadales bacterium]
MPSLHTTTLGQLIPMDLSSIQPFLDWLTAHQQWVAVCIVVIAFLESLAIAGIVIPGVLLLFGASAVAGSGTLGLWPTLLSALIGAVLGDCISFFLGKVAKHRIRGMWPFRKYPQWLDNGEKFFNRHGGKSIIIGRFVGPIRPVLPLVAGMLDMSSLRFVSINFVSALGWAPLYMLPGYLFGMSLQGDITLPDGLGELGLLLLAAAGVAFIVIRLSHWHLQPDARLYRTLHNWIDRQHNVRIFWHWLADRRDHSPTFPLLSMLLCLSSITALLLMWLLDTQTNLFTLLDQQVSQYFEGIQHPWLEALFNYLARLVDAVFLIGFASIFIIGLIAKRHFTAALHIIVALLINELLRNLVPGTQLTGITLTSCLMAAFVAQELNHQRRWWVYSATLLPITLATLPWLYVDQISITDMGYGILMGTTLCGVIRISFSRHNRHAINADPVLWLSSIMALIWSIFYIGFF